MCHWTTGNMRTLSLCSTARMWGQECNLAVPIRSAGFAELKNALKKRFAVQLSARMPLTRYGQYCTFMYCTVAQYTLVILFKKFTVTIDSIDELCGSINSPKAINWERPCQLQLRRPLGTIHRATIARSSLPLLSYAVYLSERVPPTENPRRSSKNLSGGFGLLTLLADKSL